MSKKNKKKMKNRCHDCGTTIGQHWTDFPQPDGTMITKCGKCAGTAPDWDGLCDSCGGSPILPVTGLCGPCTFGDSETIGGNW